LPLFRWRLHRFRMELDVYAYVVDRWNRLVDRSGPRGIEAFYAFLMNVYEALDRLRRSVPEQRLAATVEAWGRLDPLQPNPLFADLTPITGAEPIGLMLDGIRETVERLVPVAGDAERPAPAPRDVDVPVPA
jgi:hypothetical protein